MRQGLHLSELPDRDLGIDLRRRELAVAQDRLDVTDVCPVIEHQRRHRVTEDVAAPALLDPRRRDVLLHQVREPVLSERLTELVQEQSKAEPTGAALARPAAPVRSEAGRRPCGGSRSDEGRGSTQLGAGDELVIRAPIRPF